MKTNKNSTFFIVIILFILFVVLNLLFLSIISIGLYKFICYDKQNELLKIDFIYKSSYVFYSKNEFYSFLLPNTFLPNKFIFNNFILEENLSVFFENSVFKTLTFFTYLDNDITDNSNKNINLIFLNFFIRSSNLNIIHSMSLQKTIIINFNESSLFFFRIYNPSHVHLKIITLYMIYPNTLTLYINKIQCFCFNTLLLSPLEIVDLPVLIYIYPFSLSYFFSLNNIIIYYIIFLS